LHDSFRPPLKESGQTIYKQIHRARGMANVVYNLGDSFLQNFFLFFIKK